MFNLELVLLMCLPCLSEQTVASTAQGAIRGVDHDGYVSYSGVPYGTVSGTNGRYKTAGLAPSWSGIRESHVSHCSTISVVEDCLQLDVHVPSASSSLLPVLVWVTGGSGRYHPDKLVQQGVIVVVVYHRLGPLGFLCLGEDMIPGNAGVKDVVLALRWVKDNIVAFKGNAAKVVVGGQSFGAAMVEALTLSPMGQGLYHAVILQSGTILSPWAFNYDANQRAMALTTLLSDRTAILLDAKIEDLVAKADLLGVPYFPFGMCVEKPMKNEERLLFEAPYDSLVSKKVAAVPMIIGYNSDEAYVFASKLKEASVIRRMNSNVNFLLPEELKFLNEREMKQVGRQMEDMYFKNNFTIAAVLVYHRDAYFVNHIHRAVRLHASASNSPVYYYQFSYNGNSGVQPEPGVSKTGAAHSDELAYLFSKGNFIGDDSILQKRLVKLWSNFVKYLNPTPQKGESIQWEPTTPDNLRLLDIGNELTLTVFPYMNTAQMWDDIFETYYYSRNKVNPLK